MFLGVSTATLLVALQLCSAVYAEESRKNLCAADLPCDDTYERYVKQVSGKQNSYALLSRLCVPGRVEHTGEGRVSVEAYGLYGEVLLHFNLSVGNDKCYYDNKTNTKVVAIGVDGCESSVILGFVCTNKIINTPILGYIIMSPDNINKLDKADREACYGAAIKKLHTYKGFISPRPPTVERLEQCVEKKSYSNGIISNSLVGSS